MKDERPGVRGPRGPVPSGGTPNPPPRTSGEPNALQRVSLPLVTRLSRTPRWLIVIVLAVLLVLGMVQTGSLAWLGALILGFLTLFFAWLLALSWPAVPTSGRLLRLLVVVALGGLTVLKAMGSI
ncbi:MAG: DUF6703 family protein [Candidatus Nanopelagicales bacterium]|jgi:hypothetical protein